MADNILKEFLVALGFKVDQAGMKRFNGVIDTATASVAKLGASMGITAGAIEFGVAKIAARFEDLYFASQRTKATVENIEALQFAGRQVGLTADVARGSLESFAAALRANPGLTAWLRNMGVDTAGDTTATLRSFIGSLQNKPAFLQQAIASQFGTDPTALRNILNNPEQYDQAQAEHIRIARSYGVNENEASEAGHRFETTLRSLQERFLVLGERLGISFMPYAEQLLKWLSSGIDRIVAFEERTKILERAFGAVRDAVVGFARAIGEAVGPANRENLDAWLKIVNLGLKSTADLIRVVVDLLTGQWTKAWADAAAFKNDFIGAAGGTIDLIEKNRAVASAERAPGSNKAFQAIAFFESQGWSHAQASGIAANLYRESYFDPQADNGTHHGIAQWDASRQELFKKWAGHDIGQSTFAEQLAFVQHELNRSESTAGAHLRDQSNPYDAAVIFGKEYERFGDNADEAARRGQLAVNISQKTDIHISGSGDPAATGRSVAAEQDRVNGDLVRNTKGAVR